MLASTTAAVQAAERRAQAAQTRATATAAAAEQQTLRLKQAQAEAAEARRADMAQRQQLSQPQKTAATTAAEMEKLRQEQVGTQDKLQAALAKLAEVRREGRGLVVTLPGSIYFGFDRSEVKPGLRARLLEIARGLQKIPGREILVEGYTDSTGSATYNASPGGAPNSHRRGHPGGPDPGRGVRGDAAPGGG